MDMKEAVQRAKSFVAELYSGEPITDIGLEEVERRDSTLWHVTIGFNRQTPANKVLGALGGSMRRSYKVLTIHDKSGEVVTLKDRELSA